MSRLLVIILFALPLVYSHCPIGAKCQSESHGNPIKVTHTKASIKVKLNSPEHLFNSDNNTESIEKHEHEQNISASIDHSNLNINSTIDSTSSPDKNDSSHAASNIDANGEKIGVKIEQNATIPSGFPTDNTTSTNETSTITVDGHNSNFTEAVGNTTHSESSSNGTDSTVNGNSISSANVSAEGNISHSISEFPSTSEPREPIATSATSFPIVGENSTSNATDNKIDSNSTTGEPHNENKTYSTAASTELPFETTKEPQTSQFPSLNVTDHTNESKNETSLGSTTSPFIDTTDKHNQSISGATESPFDHTNEKGNHSNVAFTELPFTGTNEPHFSPFPSSIGTTEGEKMNSTESPLNGTSKSSIDHTETPNQTEIPILGSTSSSVTNNSNCPVLRSRSKTCDNEGTCYKHSDKVSYCICKDQFGGENCQNKKPGLNGVRKKVKDLQVHADSKFVNKKVEDGSTWGRHFAETVDECAHLCQLAGRSCRSFNFGEENGAHICELLQIRVPSEDKIFKSWIEKNHPGWSYVCCFE